MKALNGIHERSAPVSYIKDCSMPSLVTLTLGLSSPSYFDVVELIRGNKSHDVIEDRIVYSCTFRNILFYCVDNGFYVELDMTHH